MAQTSNDTRIENPKGDKSRVPKYMWYRRAWKYQGMGVSKALKIIWEGMLRWRRRKLIIFFLSGIKVEIVSMEECWHQPRGKGVGRKVCVGR